MAASLDLDSLLALNGDTRTAFARSPVQPPPSFVTHAKKKYCEMYGFDPATFEKQVYAHNECFPEYLAKKWAQRSSTWKAADYANPNDTTKPNKAEPKKADGLKKRAPPGVTGDKPAKVARVSTAAARVSTAAETEESKEKLNISGYILKLLHNKVTRPAALIFAASLGVDVEKTPNSSMLLAYKIVEALTSGKLFEEPNAERRLYMYEVMAAQVQSGDAAVPAVFESQADDAAPHPGTLGGKAPRTAKPASKPDASDPPDAAKMSPSSKSPVKIKKPPVPPVEPGVEALETAEAVEAEAGEAGAEAGKAAEEDEEKESEKGEDESEKGDDEDEKSEKGDDEDDSEKGDEDEDESQKSDEDEDESQKSDEDEDEDEDETEEESEKGDDEDDDEDEDETEEDDDE